MSEKWLRIWGDDYYDIISKHKYLKILSFVTLILQVIILIIFFPGLFLSDATIGEKALDLIVMLFLAGLVFAPLDVIVRRKIEVQQNIRTEDDRLLTRLIFRYKRVLQISLVTGLLVAVLSGFVEDTRFGAFTVYLGPLVSSMIILTAGLLLIGWERKRFLEKGNKAK